MAGLHHSRSLFLLRFLDQSIGLFATSIATCMAALSLKDYLASSSFDADIHHPILRPKQDCLLANRGFMYSGKERSVLKV